MKQYTDIILASGSPRRKELLTLAGLKFDVIVSDAEETLIDAEPAELVKHLAKKKAAAVAALPHLYEKHGPLIIIGADTIVVRDGTILGKPHNEAEALDMLMSLNGRSHQVFTGVCALSPKQGVNARPDLLFSEETEVCFSSFSEAQAREYIATGEPMDKAGAYAVQGLGSFLVKGITGDFHNVMGFPLGSFLRKGFKAGWFEL